MVLKRSTKAATPGSNKRFQYHQRTVDEVRRRATQSGGARDNYINQDIKFYAPKDKENHLRILPPTWDNPDHFGYNVFVHYSVGADNGVYLCLDKMNDQVGVCPICIERAEAEKQGEKDYASQLKPGKRVLVYVIDRDKESDGVLMWGMPWSVDKDIALRMIDKTTNEVLFIDHPEEGYDVRFNKDGKAQHTKYSGIEIDRRPSPLSDDEEQAAEWMKFVQEHPIPDQLVFYDAEHIAKVFAGAVASKQEKEDDEEARGARSTATPPFRGSKKVAPPQEEQEEEAEEEAQTPPPRKALKKSKPEGPTWDEVHTLGWDALVDLAAEKGIDDDQLPEDVNELTEEQLADVLCELLGIEAPPQEEEEPAPKASSGNKLRAKLGKLRPR